MSIAKGNTTTTIRRKNAYARASCVCAKIQSNLKNIEQSEIPQGGKRGEATRFPPKASAKKNHPKGDTSILCVHSTERNKGNRALILNKLASRGEVRRTTLVLNRRTDTTTVCQTKK